MPLSFQEREVLSKMERAIDRITITLGDIEKRVESRIRMSLEPFIERFERLEERVEQHHDYLFIGNGRTSVATQLKQHEDNQERLEEIRRLIAARRWDVVKLLASAFLGAMLTLLVERLKGW